MGPALPRDSCKDKDQNVVTEKQEKAQDIQGPSALFFLTPNSARAQMFVLFDKHVLSTCCVLRTSPGLWGNTKCLQSNYTFVSSEVVQMQRTIDFDFRRGSWLSEKSLESPEAAAESTVFLVWNACSAWGRALGVFCILSTSFLRQPYTIGTIFNLCVM
jgi:hypothetical protein